MAKPKAEELQQWNPSQSLIGNDKPTTSATELSLKLLAAVQADEDDELSSLLGQQRVNPANHAVQIGEANVDT